jgi:ubiquinone/menaquinone biosynthesis C-methylase UbiE
MLQAAILKPITRRLLLEAGLQPGMRVLDIGCGSGDVSLLLAEMVGPTGSVVGIDRSPAALALASNLVRAAGHPGVTFHEAATETYADPAPFDLAIGRYILMHQADPAVMIRAAASHVRMGGGVAFHEVGVFGTFEMRPSVPLWQQSRGHDLWLATLKWVSEGKLIETISRGQVRIIRKTPIMHRSKRQIAYVCLWHIAAQGLCRGMSAAGETPVGCLSYAALLDTIGHAQRARARGVEPLSKGGRRSPQPNATHASC